MSYHAALGGIQARLGTLLCYVLRATAACVFNALDCRTQDKRKCMCMVVTGRRVGLKGSEIHPACILTGSFEFFAQTGKEKEKSWRQEFSRYWQPILLPTVFDAVVGSVTSNSAHVWGIIDAPTDTGKMYTEKVNFAHLRYLGKLIFRVASTDIVGLQLPGGWTGYPMFKLPLEARNIPSATCNPSVETQRGVALRNATLSCGTKFPCPTIFLFKPSTPPSKISCVTIFPSAAKPCCSVETTDKIGHGKFGGDAETVDAALISTPLRTYVKRLRLNISQHDKQNAPYAAFARDVGIGAHTHATIAHGTTVISLVLRSQYT